MKSLSLVLSKLSARLRGLLRKERPRCRFCKRPMNDPSSIARGYGPSCAKKSSFELLKATTVASTILDDESEIRIKNASTEISHPDDTSAVYGHVVDPNVTSVIINPVPELSYEPVPDTSGRDLP